MLDDAGLQPDDAETNPPEVGMSPNGDVTVAYLDRFLRFTVSSITKQRRRLDAFVTVHFKPDPGKPARRLIACP